MRTIHLIDDVVPILDESKFYVLYFPHNSEIYVLTECNDPGTNTYLGYGLQLFDTIGQKLFGRVYHPAMSIQEVLNKCGIYINRETGTLLEFNNKQEFLSNINNLMALTYYI